MNFLTAETLQRANPSCDWLFDYSDICPGNSDFVASLQNRGYAVILLSDGKDISIPFDKRWDESINATFSLPSEVKNSYFGPYRTEKGCSIGFNTHPLSILSVQKFHSRTLRAQSQSNK